ncbi:prepilin-type N-terminal cleavage/methylation domain-containing protein, partial [Heyndrickxia coagulans]
MLHKKRKLLKNQKGFTLIELLAVIVILAIIAAIAIPAI